MSALALAGALAVGAAFGYGAQRGAFCMNSGLRNAAAGDLTKLKALALAVAVQLIVLPVVFALSLAQPATLPLKPWGALAGGLLFGLSMRWAGACAAGVLYKLGAGDVGALLALVGVGLGATLTESGPLSPARIAIQQTAIDPCTPAPAVSILAWPASAAHGRHFGLAVVPGMVGIMSGIGGVPFPPGTRSSSRVWFSEDGLALGNRAESI